MGLVYGCTDIPRRPTCPLYQRPWFWAVIVGVVFVVLQYYFLVRSAMLATWQERPIPSGSSSACCWLITGS